MSFTFLSAKLASTRTVRHLSDIAMTSTLRAAFEELSILESTGVSCLQRLRHSFARDARLPQLATLFEALLREPETSKAATDEVRCTFCNKNAHNVRVVVRAPLATICGECIEICEGALRERGRRWFSWLVDSTRKPARRTRCDDLAAKLAAVAESVVGHDDSSLRLRRVLGDAALTPTQVSYLAHVLSSASTQARKASAETIVCSFCGRADRDVFVQAIGAVICDVCVASASTTARRKSRTSA
jgi:hypothetical protein